MTTPIHTLYDASRYRLIIRARCDRGRRHADYPADDLAKRFGKMALIRELPFRCGECGKRATWVKACEILE